MIMIMILIVYGPGVPRPFLSYAGCSRVNEPIDYR